MSRKGVTLVELLVSESFCRRIIDGQFPVSAFTGIKLADDHRDNHRIIDVAFFPID